MINFIKGAKIQNSSQLKEGYRIVDSSIEAVVDAEKIADILKLFVKKFCSQNFFIFIEVPCNLAEENNYHSQGDNGLHKNVFYLDNISANTVNELLDLFGEIMINDGMVCFGIGTKDAEIGKYKYNMMIGYSKDTHNLESIFVENDIQKNNALIVPWDLINKNNPGESIKYEDKQNRTVYDVINVLSEMGLYKHETRNE